MPTQNNIVSLLVGGKTHQNWSGYDIDSDLLTPADAFNLSLGLPDGVIPPVVIEGATVEVKVGEETVLTGRIDDITQSIDKNNHSLNVNGRDGAAVLLDCSAPIFNAQNLSLKEIIDKLVKPLGVTKVRIEADQPTVTNKVQIEPGETAWEALVKYAEANGLWPWFEPDGTLVVGGPDYTTEPVADLIIRFDGTNNNVESLKVTRSMADRFSEVTVLGQSHTGKHNIKATAKDEDVTVYRPKTCIEGDIDNVGQAIKRAKKIISDSRLQGLTIEAEVKGHRTDNGILWQPGQRVHLVSEPHNIDDVFFLMARRFSMSRTSAARTVLMLKEDGAWVLDAKPSKEKKAQGKKTKKGRAKRGRGKKTHAPGDIKIYVE